MFSKFQSRIKDAKQRELDITRQTQRPPWSNSCGKLLNHDEKNAFVAQTF
jgi:hypothetical protein